MKKPNKIIVDEVLELMDIYECQITFSHDKETGKEIAGIMICDSKAGTFSFPLERVEVMF